MIDNIKDTLENVVSHITFTYNELPCGIDPISESQFDMWYGDSTMSARNTVVPGTITVNKRYYY